MKSTCYKLLIATSASRHNGPRSSRLVQIYGAAAQRLPEPVRSNAWRRQTYKIRSETERKSPAQTSCPVEFKAAASLKSL
jgi:hypothetical protein